MVTTLEQIKKASEKLDEVLIAYYTMVLEYYGLPRQTCDKEQSVFNLAKDFKERMGIELIERELRKNDE